MAELLLGNHTVDSYFELLGTKEDHMTYGLGYALSQSGHFLNLVLRSYGLNEIDSSSAKVQLQRHESRDQGYTDVEIWFKGRRILIIEVKKGWVLPSTEQLEKYRARFSDVDLDQVVGVLSECSSTYAKLYLDSKYPFTSWSKIWEFARQAHRKSTSSLEKASLKEYSSYLEKVIIMNKQESNLAYCVVLSTNKVPGSKISYRDVVYKHQKYFYSYDKRKGWPNPPPNYMAFRTDGRLNSIHKVETFEVIDNLNQSLPGIINCDTQDLHFLLNLGPPIRPQHEVLNGKLWSNGRVWCMLDTLLTCNTISEARDLTKMRLGENI